MSTRCEFNGSQVRHSLSLSIKLAKSFALPVTGALGPSTFTTDPGKRRIKLSPGLRDSVVPNRPAEPRSTVPESVCSRPCASMPEITNVASIAYGGKPKPPPTRTLKHHSNSHSPLHPACLHRKTAPLNRFEIDIRARVTHQAADAHRASEHPGDIDAGVEAGR
jgi:hypothetical protein